MTTAISIPVTVDAIDAEWLTAALRQTFPRITITAAKIIEIIHGTSSKVRIEIESDDPAAPPRVLVKGGFEDHSREMRYMHLMEMHSYHDLIPSVGIEAPRCYFAGCNDKGYALVVLEDLSLRGVQFLSLQAPIDFALAARFLEQLARLHARWWNSPELAEGGAMSWAPESGGAGSGRYLRLLTTPESFRHYTGLPRGAAIPVALHNPARIERAHATLRALQREMPPTINHGDMHLGNLYLTEFGEPGFLDWHPRRAAWAIDVTYFMVAALDPPDRCRWQGPLLDHYLRELLALGVAAPDHDTAWLAYRRHVVWGLLIWLFNGSQFQTEAANTAAAFRFGQAMIDLETFEALAV